jgi:hypothetical protein
MLHEQLLYEVRVLTYLLVQVPYHHLHIYPSTALVHSVAKIPKEERVRLPTPPYALRNMITVNSHVCRKAKHICTSLITRSFEPQFCLYRLAAFSHPWVVIACTHQ